MRVFRIIAAALVSIAASLKSIAVNLATLVNQSDELSEEEKAAINKATEDLKASHDRLQDAVTKNVTKET